MSPTNPSLEVRNLSSPDVELYAWSPELLSEVFLLLELEIGEVGAKEASVFYVIVATPEALRARAKEFVLAERATLVVSEFSLPRIRDTVTRIVRSCARATWAESAAALGRHFRWEYDDYKP